jgi:hypothetical protein
MGTSSIGSTYYYYCPVFLGRSGGHTVNPLSPFGEFETVVKEALLLGYLLEVKVSQQEKRYKSGSPFRLKHSLRQFVSESRSFHKMFKEGNICHQDVQIKEGFSADPPASSRHLLDLQRWIWICKVYI